MEILSCERLAVVQEDAVGAEGLHLHDFPKDGEKFLADSKPFPLVGAKVSYHGRRWQVHVASAFPLAGYYRAVFG